MNNAKEYLSRAFHIDKQIKAKTEQLSSLRALAETTTAQPLTDMPGSPNRNIDKMEKTVVKIVDLEKEIYEEIDKLVSFKVELTHKIKEVEDVDCQLVLELRYLCFMTWEDIAADMNCSVRNIHLLHGRALSIFQNK